jgi:hypothetical protein
MEDLCDKCSGWIIHSPTADAHDPETWCTCALIFKRDTTEESEEVL